MESRYCIGETLVGPLAEQLDNLACCMDSMPRRDGVLLLDYTAHRLDHYMGQRHALPYGHQ